MEGGCGGLAAWREDGGKVEGGVWWTGSVEGGCGGQVAWREHGGRIEGGWREDVVDSMLSLCTCVCQIERTAVCSSG